MGAGRRFFGRLVAALVWVGLGTGAARAEKKKPAPHHWLDLPIFRQRDAARELSPSGLDLTSDTGAQVEIRAIRLRIYADRDYRQLVLRWRAKVHAQIDRINGVVQPVFGVRVEIESLREWDRSHTGLPLNPLLDELEALDPAEQVDWVLGLATPLRGVATNVHQIGSARLLARPSSCAGWTTSRRRWPSSAS